MYKKLLLVVSFSFVHDTIFSMNASSSRLEVTVECNEMLKQLDKAGTALIYYYQAVFNSYQDFVKNIGETKTHELKPSDLIKSIRPHQEDDKDMKDFFGTKTADWYIDVIVAPHYDALDKAFNDNLEKTKNVEKTWQMFGEYFENEGIKKPFGAYKKKLAYEDNMTLNLRRAAQSEDRMQISPDGQSLFCGQSMSEFMLQNLQNNKQN